MDPKTNERSILGEISRETADEIRQNLMKQGDEERDTEAIKAVTQRVSTKSWKIYKVREDKSLPNNTEIVKKIEESIKDGITQEVILKHGKDINTKAFNV